MEDEAPRDDTARRPHVVGAVSGCCLVWSRRTVEDNMLLFCFNFLYSHFYLLITAVGFLY
jgi:hypothetical protein